MAKIIFEFSTKEAADKWLGMFYDGGGEQEMMEGFSENGEEYESPVITQED